MDIPFSGHKDNKRNSLLASTRCIIEKALLYARLLKYEKDFPLPDSKHMLHGKTGDRDTDPTAETKSEPVLISLMIFVFRPTALMARTMKNLLSVFSGVNTSADTPAEVAIVVITEARTK